MIPKDTSHIYAVTDEKKVISIPYTSVYGKVGSRPIKVSNRPFNKVTRRSVDQLNLKIEITSAWFEHLKTIDLSDNKRVPDMMSEKFERFLENYRDKNSNLKDCTLEYLILVCR